ncbi:bifunctional ornithine acetyltransferase/N-acetylglutamate synthase [Bacillus sp. AFS076308]|uniref:bifunctional ornithine acetyltransferase/N-acetylglutamate synthase n=1 Tax=unclassified Bacillus (in: firmicutes) TaxID=185979 RepID=UPI000BF6A5BF|nr:MULTISPECIES: bifunctional ornithine acetyltransferase/N-acetylglutamate synthase [unclassified Bacillus (in: firmicutes)]PFO01362.1 bifunctional ornithine acetyltransferase/N-acetylglutamate synthase [Bacillus sp. AFS076308]PGV52205.1 bifunctional ornithine acetyltransferase/N-acetylglutamate synthase [Bacillus sp. AFS037270]
MPLLLKDKIVEIENGNILSPQGFTTAGVHAGLRYAKKDIGVIISEIPASSAAVYTTNQFQAAPLKVTQESIASEGLLQAVVVNSACANACTGDRGYMDALKMRSLTSEKFNIKEHYIAVASTGVIGEYLDMDKITNGIESLSPGKLNSDAVDFQTAILTTDIVMKSCGYTASINGRTITIGGAAKGSGMIHPNMATMLGFLTTDAAISSEHLSAALKNVTNNTFNQITVDGDTSTNDMVLVMANGMAENLPLTPDHPEWETFIELLTKACEKLAKQIAMDGEGATKLVEVEVLGAKDHEEAKFIAKQIVGSNLVKTAIFGADANWGRIIGAIGQTNAVINPHRVDIAIGPIQMLKNSVPCVFSENEARGYLNQPFIQILVDLHVGNGEGKAWGCDLSYKYVKINASYRS